MIEKIKTNPSKTKEEILAMSDEEARAWIDECEINTSEHIRRHNLVYGHYGLYRAGILCAESIRSGELTLDAGLYGQ